MGKVLFISQRDYGQHNIDNAVLRAFNHFGGVENFIKHGENVLLKVNLVAGHDITRRVTTDPSIVRAVAKLVLSVGAKPFIADSPGIDNFKSAAKKAGFLDIADELGIECKELTEPVTLPVSKDSDFHKIQVSRDVINHGSQKFIRLHTWKAQSRLALQRWSQS